MFLQAHRNRTGTEKKGGWANSFNANVKENHVLSRQVLQVKYSQKVHFEKENVFSRK